MGHMRSFPAPDDQPAGSKAQPLTPMKMTATPMMLIGSPKIRPDAIQNRPKAITIGQYDGFGMWMCSGSACSSTATAVAVADLDAVLLVPQRPRAEHVRDPVEVVLGRR